MSNQTLTFNLPVNPKPSKSKLSATIVANDGWQLTVKKTGTSHSRISPAIVVSVSSAHYDSFCDAFQGNQGSKNVFITFSGNVVNSIDWGAGVINLPDNTALIAALARDRAFDLELGGEILTELRQLNETMAELLYVVRDRGALLSSESAPERASDIRGLGGESNGGRPVTEEMPGGE